MEGRKEILLYPSDDDGSDGFVVKISIWVNESVLSLAPMNRWEGFFHPHDIVLDDLNKIREFILSTEHWKINVDEFVLQLPPSKPILISEAENKWFAGVKFRALIREPLVGYFLNYPLLIGLECRFHVPLIKSSSGKKPFHCDWSGGVSDLVSQLRQSLRRGGFPETELKIWIARYYRQLSMNLSVAKCESIARKVLSMEDADNSSLDYDSASEIEDLSPPTVEQLMEGFSNKINVVLDNQQKDRDILVAAARKIYQYPLLAVMSRYQPSSLVGELKSFASQAIGRSTYRAHFLCSVCGCKSPTAGKGYKLNFGAEGTEHLMTAFQMSLTFLQIMLNLGGVPNQISVLADLATTSLDILTTDLRGNLQKFIPEKDIAEIDSMRSCLAKHSTPSRKDILDGDVVANRAVLLDSSKTVSPRIVPGRLINAAL